MLTLIACGPRKPKQTPVSRYREFPMTEIPMAISDPLERACWLAEHYWDRYTAPDSLYYCDSVTVSGVPKEKLEQQMGVFATLLREIPLDAGVNAMDAFFQRLETFQKAHPEGNVFSELTQLTHHYFYDPNSPLRNEDLYRPFVYGMSLSECVSPGMRQAYAHDAQMCALNAVGTRAADFTFIDTKGRKRTLYSLKADIILLIFGNPDCTACRELMESMSESAELMECITSGQLLVVDIYIDEDLDAWKAHQDQYPKEWINGYDPNFIIRTDRIYNVRAVPSLYLLDRDKTVLLKDAQAEDILDALSY